VEVVAKPSSRPRRRMGRSWRPQAPVRFLRRHPSAV